MSKKIFLSLLFIVALSFPVFIPVPQKADAFQIFSPFGGQVNSYSKTTSSCDATLAPINMALAFVGLHISFEELKIKSAGSIGDKKLGILNINGIRIPELPKIYDYDPLKTLSGWRKDTWVLGNSFDLCNVCGIAGDIPVIKGLCKTKAVKKLLDFGCSAMSASCPTNLIYKIGQSRNF